MSEDQSVLWREHEFRIDSAASYFELLARFRHVRYELDALLFQLPHLSFGRDVAKENLAEGQDLLRRYAEIERPPEWNKKEDGTVERRPIGVDHLEMTAKLKKQLVLWQEMLQWMYHRYWQLTALYKERLLALEAKEGESILPELVEMHLLAFQNQVDPDPPRITVVFQPPEADAEDISVTDASALAQRARAYFCASMRAVGAYQKAAVERRREEKLTAMTRRIEALTGILVALTVVLLILTCVMAWPMISAL